MPEKKKPKRRSMKPKKGLHPNSKKALAEARKKRVLKSDDKEKLRKLEAEELLAVQQNKVDQITQRQKIEELLEEKGYDPVSELIESALARDDDGKLILDAKERNRIAFKFLDKKYGDMKHLDIDANMRMQVSVVVQAYKGATVEELKPINQVPEEDYDEFISSDDVGTE